MKKIAIIGGGPIGLYFASLCEKAHLDYTVFEASEKVGGQIHLYPAKKFLDVDGFMNQEAIKFVEALTLQVCKDNIKLNTKVNDIKESTDKVTLITTAGNFDFDYAVIAIGLGSYTPRPLGVEHEAECKNIIYTISDFSFLANKRVAIFGGGDSALDWAKEISMHSDDVHLVHRRTEFRGNVNTIKDCKTLKVHLPYVPHHIALTGDHCTSITIKNVNSEEMIEIPVDYVIVNYGCIPTMTPFNYPHEGNFLKGNEKHALSARVYAIGDCLTYQDKKRRIEPGKAEANLVLAALTQLA